MPNSEFGVLQTARTKHTNYPIAIHIQFLIFYEGNHEVGDVGYSPTARERQGTATRLILSLAICISWLAATARSVAQEPDNLRPQATEEPDFASGLPASSPDEPRWFELQGRLEADFLATAQSPSNESTFGDLGDAIGLRRAWVGAKGSFDWGRYVTEIDLASGEIVIRDVFVGMGDVQGTGERRVGHYLEPFSLEVNTASFAFPFMECSVASIFAPARNWGLGLFQARDGDAITFSLGVFQAGSDPNDFESGPGSNLGLTGRITTAPVHEGDEGPLVHFGIALSGRIPEQGTILVDQQPQTPLLGLGDVASSPFIPRILIPAQFQQLANLQFATARGSQWLQAEWYGSWIDQTDGGPLFFHGSYVACGWFLTGEHRPYQETTGTFGPVRVHRPVYCRHANGECETGWGGWELAARIAYIDLQDADSALGPNGQVVGIQLPELTVGVNWYLTDHIRFMTNYSYALPEEPNTGTSAAHLFGARLGIFW